VLRFVTRRYGAFTQTRGRKPGAGVAAQKIISGGGSFSRLAAFLGRSPDTASFEDVRGYQLHLAASGVGVPTDQF
jgi:hypothetical protein